MASRNISDLVPIMQEKAAIIMSGCEDAGFELLIYCTYRSLEEQAKLFRQGRIYDEIKAKMDRLKKLGFDFLADIIENVGPQHENKKVTYAGPGESWHNFREAFDAVPVVSGKALWNDSQKYDIYGQLVVQSGLDWGGAWSKLKDKPHAQLRFGVNPLKVYSPDQVKEFMKNNNVN